MDNGELVESPGGGFGWPEHCNVVVVNAIRSNVRDEGAESVDGASERCDGSVFPSELPIDSLSVNPAAVKLGHSLGVSPVRVDEVHFHPGDGVGQAHVLFEEILLEP